MAGMTLQRPVAQRAGGVELFAWYFLRVSGLALVVLALGHIFITHYLTVPAETRLQAKEKRLKAQFAAMETALLNSQTQSAWLSGQLSSLSN